MQAGDYFRRPRTHACGRYAHRRCAAGSRAPQLDSREAATESCQGSGRQLPGNNLKWGRRWKGKRSLQDSVDQRRLQMPHWSGNVSAESLSFTQLSPLLFRFHFALAFVRVLAADGTHDRRAANAAQLFDVRSQTQMESLMWAAPERAASKECSSNDSNRFYI